MKTLKSFESFNRNFLTPKEILDMSEEERKNLTTICYKNNRVMYTEKGVFDFNFDDDYATWSTNSGDPSIGIELNDEINKIYDGGDSEYTYSVIK